MVNYLLTITAELENLTDLQPQGGCDDPNFNFSLKTCPCEVGTFFCISLPSSLLNLFIGGKALKCGNCGELTAKETWLSLGEPLPGPNGKGTTHLIQKCKFCAREGTVTMIPGKGHPLTRRLSEIGKHAPVMHFDCRGFEPVEFVIGSGWQAVSIAGTKYENIDLSGGEFTEYDEKGKLPVMISNVSSEFNVVK